MLGPFCQRWSLGVVRHASISPSTKVDSGIQISGFGKRTALKHSPPFIKKL